MINAALARRSGWTLGGNRGGPISPLRFSDRRSDLLAGAAEEPNPYGDKPHVTTRTFWESGEALRLTHGPIAIACPIRLLHGQADPDVNFAWSLEIARLVHSADVQTILVKHGDHRLSREEDLALLVATVSRLMESL